MTFATMKRSSKRNRTVFGMRQSATPPLSFVDDNEWLEWERTNIVTSGGGDAIKAAKDRIAVAQLVGDISLDEHNKALAFIDGVVGTLRRCGRRSFNGLA